MKGGKGSAPPAGSGGEGPAGDVALVLDRLFTQLDGHVRNANHEQAAKTAAEILEVAPGDEDATHCLAVAELHLRHFDKALAVLEASPAVASNCSLERAYCLYRMQRHSDALALLKAAGGKNTLGELSLQAQILYREGQFSEVVAVLTRLVQEHPTEVGTEIATNLLAAAVGAGRAAEADALVKDLPSDSFETTYNRACAALDQGNLEDAWEGLRRALRMGKETLLEEDYGEEEIEEELLPITVQLAYTESLMGKTDDAAATYARLLKAKYSDAPSMAVVTNNSIAARGASEMLDALKRIDKLLDKGSGQANSTKFQGALEFQLSAQQKRVLLLNRATLLLLTHKMDQCRELVNTLATRQPNDERVVLLKAALLLQDKKPAKADELLAAHAAAAAAAGAAPSLEVVLARAQAAALSSDPASTSAALAALPPRVLHSPRIVATRVALCPQGQDPQAVLDEAVAFWARQKDAESQALGDAVGRAAAEHRLRIGRPGDASALFERLAKSASTPEAREEALLGMVMASHETDLATAERIAAEVAPKFAADLDAEELEVVAAQEAAKGGLLERSRKRDCAPGADGADAGAEGEKAKKKRRRHKPRLPKGFDPANPGPPPDPERWLPLRERSTWKSKRKLKGGPMKGAQGAAPAAAMVAAAKTPEPKAAPEAAAGSGSSSKKKKGKK